LAGQLRSDARPQVLFDGDDITIAEHRQRALRGLVRSFQITRLFKSFSVLDNVALALQAVSGSSLRAWRRWRGNRAVRGGQGPAGRVGLDVKVAYSIDRCRTANAAQLEVGMALASRPRWCCSTSRWPAWGPRNRHA
jgi:branched-chain amino acid transport system ATP-binding protein